MVTDSTKRRPVKNLGCNRNTILLDVVNSVCNTDFKPLIVLIVYINGSQLISFFFSTFYKLVCKIKEHFYNVADFTISLSDLVLL